MTFTGTVACNIPAFAYGYYGSTHLPGRTTDADFSFLLGNAVTQAFGIVIACMPLRQNSDLSPYLWTIPPAVALLSTSAAPIIYCLLPTEWSQFAMLLGAAMQAFFVMQLALLGCK